MFDYEATGGSVLIGKWSAIVGVAGVCRTSVGFTTMMRLAYLTPWHPERQIYTRAFKSLLVDNPGIVFRSKLCTSTWLGMVFCSAFKARV